MDLREYEKEEYYKIYTYKVGLLGNGRMFFALSEEDMNTESDIVNTSIYSNVDLDEEGVVKKYYIRKDQLFKMYNTNMIGISISEKICLQQIVDEAAVNRLKIMQSDDYVIRIVNRTILFMLKPDFNIYDDELSTTNNECDLFTTDNTAHIIPTADRPIRVAFEQDNNTTYRDTWNTYMNMNNTTRDNRNNAYMEYENVFGDQAVQAGNINEDTADAMRIAFRNNNTINTIRTDLDNVTTRGRRAEINMYDYDCPF